MSLAARLAGVLVLASALTATICVVAFAAPGDLDRTFSGDGKVTTNVTPRQDGASGVAIQADGKIVAAGSAGWMYPRRPNFALVRYKADGTLDRTFGGGDGRVKTRFTYASVATDVAIQADDRIVVVGNTNDKFALARYDRDGTLDPTFNGDGKATTWFFPLDTAAASDVAIQPDGKIVVVGTAWCEETFPAPGSCGAEEDSADIALARYDPDGTLDAGFGENGKVTTDISLGSDSASAVALQTDGKIVVAGGTDTSDFALLRYNSDGALDSSFGEAGIVTTPFYPNTSRDSFAYDVAIQADGRIVAAGVAGGIGGGFALIRYGPDGTLDTTFSEDGKVRTDFTRRRDVAYGVAIQATGKIVAAGRARIDGGRFAVARYDTDGTLDRSFSANGKVTTDFTTRADSAGDVAIQANGRIVAAGGAGGKDSRFALARYRGG